MHSGWLPVCKRIALLTTTIAGLALTMMIAPSSAIADVQISTVNYKGWKDAYRMTNGTVELIYVPAVARIMHYGYVNGANMLWENKTLSGTVADPKNLRDWRNVGGDKVWPWPQDDWGKLLPQSWPPPAAADALPQTVTVVGKDTLHVTSARVLPWGVRIVRDIRLDAKERAFMSTADWSGRPRGHRLPALPGR